VQRSLGLAHGHDLFQLDEAPWSFNMGAMAARVDEDEIYRSAITVAKTGVRSGPAPKNSGGCWECGKAR
jgi:hypothetical protein